MSSEQFDDVRVVRRNFLRTAAVLPVAYTTSAMSVRGQSPLEAPEEGGQSFPGVISRQKHPLNAEFPFPTLKSFLTPNERFYIRTHFGVPELTASQWKLSVEGHVENPFEIGYDQLRQMYSLSVTSILECSGNSRVFLQPPQVSIRWELGGVSNATWTGVPLAAVLERAGVKSGAVEVILEGHDKGRFDEPNPKTPGEIHYARSLSLNKARQQEVLLAYEMNGEELLPAHGFPVRAVVAGWYGMASVKWLRRIIITDQPFHGFFQTFMYTTWQRRHDGLPTLMPVQDIEVKSQIARPMLQEVVTQDADYRVHGAARSGEAEIAQVEVSTDGGASWAKAKLPNRSEPFAWRFFEFRWRTPRSPGRQVLMSRATNACGEVQPMERDEDRRDAVINHVQPIEVYVH